MKKTDSPIGRPRAFDIEQALESALQVFQQKGYEGASLSDLTDAMGINRPSLYAAFGSKEDLFRKALDRYVSRNAAFVHEALNAPTARAVVEQLLEGIADAVTTTCHPPGCLTVQGALSCGEEAECIRQELIARRIAFESTLRQRLERARAEGDLSATSDPADLARFVATLYQGMAVQAGSGASREDLHRVVEIAMRIWPSA